MISNPIPLRIGIVGGGQLGRMLTIAAKQLGFYVTVIDPTENSPAGQVADKQIIADFKNEDAILQLGKVSDYITFEIELANDAALEKLIKKGKRVNPSPKTLGIIRDKLIQKEFLQKNQIPTAKFIQVQTEHDIRKAAKDFGYPMLLKARTDAYDGRGNALIKEEKDIERALKKLANRQLYVEQFVRFVKELAVMIARDSNDEIVCYPTVETIHKNNICDTVMVPAPVNQKAEKNAQNLALSVVNHLHGAGVFGIEMFLKKDDNVLVNEIAPRVHNSGHYSIEACVTSQFEQHIRSITGLPLGSTELLIKAAVMKNILAEKNGSAHPIGIEKALAIPAVSVHMYGKAESRSGRKMGHITVVGNDIAECLEKAEKARKMIVI